MPQHTTGGGNMSQPTRRSFLKLGIAGVPVASLLGNALASADAATSPETQPTAPASVEKASVCFRIGQPIWTDEARFLTSY